jgi:hypothetical protein
LLKMMFYIFKSSCRCQFFLIIQLIFALMVKCFLGAWVTIALIFCSKLSYCQPQFQTVKGSVIDQQSKRPIDFASVVILNTDLEALADSFGNFRIEQVPIGRIALLVTHPSYASRQLDNIVVEAGKETVVEIEMLELMRDKVSEVEVVSKANISSGLMATVSTAEFNAEDTRRYAGSRNDVARMAANFAGVNSVNDGRNDIIIRGNSPLGLLWRLEGVDIPNPNHYGSLSATGGPVTLLNNNVVGRSAFLTGAFPAQYGNATSGVFDVNLRKGNSDRYEFTTQIGFNGLELGAEGPFNKNGKGSFLLYYRYSVPGLLHALGVNVGTGTAIPAYQDISLKAELPTKKAGTFTLFGIAGKSSIDFKGDLKDTINFYNDPYHDLYNATKMGLLGLRHTYFFNNNTSLMLTVAGTGSNVITRQDSLDVLQQPHKRYREDGREWRYVASLIFNKKISASDRITFGLTADQLHYHYRDSVLDAAYGFIPFLQGSDHTQLIRGYGQWQHRFNTRLSLNSGVYAQYLTLNKNIAIDPRLGMRYIVGNHSAVTLAYGLHSQMQSLSTYFYETPITVNQFVQTNRSLSFSKSHHLVLGWDQALAGNWRYKVEAYAQYLFNIPVEQRPSHWSALNIGAGYGAGLEDSLVNKGSGYNYGLELTVEKPFAKGYYFLGTASVFDSKYKGSNGVLHNTVFNGNYVVNILAGKEWKIADNHGIAVDIKATSAGGKRYTPIDEPASILKNQAVYIDERSFDTQWKPYFRLDIKLSYRMNRRFMQEFFVDFQNVTNTQNVFTQWYDNRSGRIRTQYQLGFYPNFNYRIQF